MERSRIDRQADTQNVRCMGVADGGRMVATPALFTTEMVNPPEISRFLFAKIPPKLFSRYVYNIKWPKTEEKQNFGGR